MVTNFPLNIRVVLIKEVQKTANVIAFLNALDCSWCGGKGHETEKCSTKFRLIAEARAADIAWDIGAIKGLCWDPEQNLTIEQRISAMESRHSRLGKRRRFS